MRKIKRSSQIEAICGRGTLLPMQDRLGHNGEHFYMYVLHCADDTLYTGYTVDVEARVASHNAGTGAKYTKARRPVALLASARFATKHEAMSAEYRFKQLTRKEKERALSQDAPFEDVLRELFPEL